MCHSVKIMKTANNLLVSENLAIYRACTVDKDGIFNANLKPDLDPLKFLLPLYDLNI